MSDPTQQIKVAGFMTPLELIQGVLAGNMDSFLALLDLHQKQVEADRAKLSAFTSGQSEQIDQLSESLAKAQGAFPAIPRRKKATVKTKDKQGNYNGEYTYWYADLADILEAVRTPLSERGIAVNQSIAIESRQGHEEGLVAVVVSTLRHASGQWLRSVLRFPTKEQDIQKLGSVFTYLRRYSIGALLGIAPEEDDDGELATQGEKEYRREAKQQAKAAKADNKRNDGDMPNEEQLAEFWASWKELASTRFASKEEATAWLKGVDPNPNKANLGKLRSIINRLKLVKDLEGKANEKTDPKGKADQAAGAGEGKKGKGKEAKPSTPEEKRRQALQTRWRMLLGDKFKRFDQAQALEAACWWAAEYFGWVRKPETEEISGKIWPTRPRASLTPVEDVARAVDELAKLSEDQVDQVFDDYSHWINEQLRELNPSAEAEPEAEAE